MTLVLDVDDVSKSYGDVVALDGVTFSIEAGEILALAGPNGAGKSTLFSIIAGVARPDTGSVTVAGGAPDGGCVGFAAQNVGLYLTMTVRENLVGFGTLEGLRGRRLRNAIKSAAESLDLEHLLDKQVRVLSSGEQRRVHVAIAVLHRPALLLLDEPTAGVDVRSRERLLRLVGQASDQGSAVCYSTHYLAELETFADRIVLLDNGTVTGNLAVSTLLAADSCRTVTLGFDGAPPADLGVSGSVTVVGHCVEILSTDPASSIRAALAALGEDADRILTIDVTRPSLEAAVLARPGSRERIGAR